MTKDNNMKKTLLSAAVALGALASFAMLSDEEAEKAARETLAKMTLEEKVLLTGGSGTMTLSAIPRVGIMKEWTMSDNSSTVRPQMNRWDWGYTSPKSQNTKLPSLSALASTWDPAMARLHGEVLGAEMRDRGVDELLGPGVNIARTPLNGRNWEYLGEDPCLAAKMCVPMIKGVQSYDVAATVKHFCLNDQEWNRNKVDTHCDLRTLHEIYLPAFRAAVQEGEVLCLMTSYNKIDGLWASENKYLQTGVLRDRWGFKGLVETDWGGQHTDAFSVNNGGGIEMDRGDEIKHHFVPKTGKMPLLDAVKAGKVSVATVDEMTLHLLYVMAKTGFLTGAPRKAGSRNTKEHQDAARKIGEESIVLAKNDKGVLPLDAKSLKKVLVLGKNANNPQCGKGCSGEGNVPYEVSFLQGLRNILGKDVEIVHKPLPKGEVKASDNSELAVDLSGVERAGGHLDKDAGKAGGKNGPGLDELKAIALASDATIVFTGTELGYDGNMESEGRDRANMLSDPGEDESVAAVLSWNAKNTVVISRAGTPVGYTWTDAAPTLLMSSYLGMEEGNSIARVVFGDVNPSGKLCHTWPKRYEDTGVSQMGTYNAKEVVYNERFYVGYRWFDYKKIEPMFPFGHGLSYTTFKVSDVEAAPAGLNWTVKAKVTNAGKVAGREVVQLYVSYPDAKVERCAKELRGFAKTKLLAPGESETVEIPVSRADFAYFDELTHKFTTDPGRYELLVGVSSRDIRGRATVVVDGARCTFAGM